MAKQFKIVKVRTFHPSRLKQENKDQRSPTIDQRVQADARDLAFMKEAMAAKAKADAAFAKRASKQSKALSREAQRAQYDRDARGARSPRFSKAAHELASQKPSAETTKATADFEARQAKLRADRKAEQLQKRGKANVREVNPNQMKAENAPDAVRGQSVDSTYEANIAKAREKYQRVVDNPRSTPESVAKAQAAYNRAQEAAEKKHGGFERSGEPAGKSDAEVMAQHERENRRALEKVANDPALAGTPMAESAKRELNEREPAGAVQPPGKSLVDQKMEAARTFAQARKLEIELDKAERTTTAAGFKSRAAMKKVESIKKKMEALKRSGAPESWGDQPRNELGQFWFK